MQRTCAFNPVTSELLSSKPLPIERSNPHVYSKSLFEPLEPVTSHPSSIIRPVCIKSSSSSCLQNIAAPLPRKACLLNQYSPNKQFLPEHHPITRSKSNETAHSLEIDTARMELINIFANFKVECPNINNTSIPDPRDSKSTDSYCSSASLTSSDSIQFCTSYAINSTSKCNLPFERINTNESPVYRTGNTLPKDNGFDLCTQNYLSKLKNNSFNCINTYSNYDVNIPERTHSSISRSTHEVVF
ncbi:hypothetical protein BB558_005272 [Smittium angustum]|uniref:Uncharacterized protein n=1 Tax=Smittium angustum TaxID=133377 RepID=A0A2U1IZH8_SMIAN|nr:hypothetical protein BB558_005866 [Smittium angustum]PVZ98730.1 hypothetical protein BB558_005272 [Smittium angustum]